MGTLISSGAPWHDVLLGEYPEKKFAVTVDPDALALLESGLRKGEQCGPSSRRATTVILSLQSATPPLKPTPSLEASSAASNGIFEEPGLEPLAALHADPDTIALAKDRTDYLCALINDIRIRVSKNAVGTLPVGLQHDIGQTLPEPANQGIINGSENPPPESEHRRSLATRIEDSNCPRKNQQPAETPVPAMQASQVTAASAPIGLTRSLLASPSGRMALWAALVGLIFLTSLCIRFLHEVPGTQNSHFGAGLVASSDNARPNRLPLDASELAGVGVQIPPTRAAAEPEAIRSHPAEAGTGDQLNPSQVEIKVLETTWVSATTNGKELLGKALSKGEITVIRFSKMILLRVGNAGGVEITLDGNPIGPIGRRGVVRLVELTPGGSRILPWSNANSALSNGNVRFGPSEELLRLSSATPRSTMSTVERSVARTP
jgi:Domain of unknown function (DUF4115)